MSIRQLSVQLANQIAAGEVVERPASVVKELLENAVDAGALRIVCQVENAGRTLVRVQDDGGGVPREDLPLVFASHATSKIYTAEDLQAISTLGFRGEALSSIASVSKVRFASRARGSAGAYAVSCQGDPGAVEIAPVAHPEGTSVEVRELFFNTPARRRFLRSDRTEFLRIKDVFIRCALANPRLDFTLLNEGKTVLEVTAAQEHTPAWRSRLSRLIGGDFVQDPLPVDYQGTLLNIQGLCLPPPLEHETIPEQIYLFLNGRPVADKLLTHALRDAYAAAAGRRCTVRCVLTLRCDPRQVDVNVHPRKDEVRFHAARLVHDTLEDCILNTLSPSAFSPLEAAGAEDEQVDESTAAYLDFIAAPKSADLFPAGEGRFIIPDPEEAKAQSPLPSAREEEPAEAGDTPEAAPAANPVSVSGAFLDRVASENAVLKASIVLPDSKGDEICSEVLCCLGEGRYFIRQGENCYIFELDLLYGALELEHYAREVNEGQVEQYRLAIAVDVKLTGERLKLTADLAAAFSRCGFEMEFLRESLLVKAVPLRFRQASCATLTRLMLACIRQHAEQILNLRTRSDFFAGLEGLVPPPAKLGPEMLLERAGDLRRLTGHRVALLLLDRNRLNELFEQQTGPEA